MDKKEVQTGLDWIRKLEDRAEEVARLLCPEFGEDTERVSFDGSTDNRYSTVTYYWSYDHFRDFPLSYLWMDNDAILADVAERKRIILVCKCCFEQFLIKWVYSEALQYFFHVTGNAQFMRKLSEHGHNYLLLNGSQDRIRPSQ